MDAETTKKPAPNALSAKHLRVRGRYRVDWFDFRNQPRSTWFDKWSEAQDEARRTRNGTVWDEEAAQ